MANDAMAITGSRVMVYTSYLDEDIPSQGVVWRVAVWDWKTGDSASLPRLDQSYSTNPAQVLDLKSTDRSALVGWNTQINFLDEFRVVILVNKSDVTELFVFNTLVPQDHPGNLRRLELPQQFHHTAAKICVDRDRSLGTQPLIPDPAQAVLVVELENSWDARVFLVVKTHALIEQTCSTFADPCVPWDEWGRDVMVMEGSMHGGNPHTFVHGAQIVVARVYGLEVNNARYNTITPSRRSTLAAGDAVSYHVGVKGVGEPRGMCGLDTKGAPGLGQATG